MQLIVTSHEAWKYARVGINYTPRKIISKVIGMTLSVDDTWLTIRKVVVKLSFRKTHGKCTEKKKISKRRDRESERERELRAMIYTECLICQNSWTFLTMIKKTLGKINNTLPFHHIWIIFFLKGNGYFFTFQIVFFF